MCIPLTQAFNRRFCIFINGDKSRNYMKNSVPPFFYFLLANTFYTISDLCDIMLVIKMTFQRLQFKQIFKQVKAFKLIIQYRKLLTKCLFLGITFLQKVYLDDRKSYVQVSLLYRQLQLVFLATNTRSEALSSGTSRVLPFSC